MGPNRCKGICFLDFARIVRESVGLAGWEKVLDALDDEVAESLRDSSILRGGWYPIQWYTHLHARAQDALAAGPELASKIGYDSTVHGLTHGIYRIMLKAVSPQTVVGGAARIFSTYYQRGSMTVVDKGPGFATARWSDCEGFDANLWADVFGGVRGALWSCGGRQVQFFLVSGGNDGDTEAEGRAQWTM